jgi:hypothetical protein
VIFVDRNVRPSLPDYAGMSTGIITGLCRNNRKARSQIVMNNN